jgi:hypothetical protein
MTKMYCILARQADRGVIFRRGSSKMTRLISWDLKTHKFEPGQWFIGRVYPSKSDLSPSGTKLVYFAAKYRAPMPTWIAVSTPPYLTAHVLWPTVGTADTISLFHSDSEVAVSVYRYDSPLEPVTGFEVPDGLQVKRKPWPGFFYKLPEHERMIRDGWFLERGDPVYRGNAPDMTEPVVYRKPIAGASRSSHLEMSAHNEQAYNYVIRDDRENLIDLKADWADVRGNDVLYSIGGKLLCLRANKPGKKVLYGPPVELADFSEMTFENVETPLWAKTW